MYNEAVIKSVAEGSIAEDAGLEAGDTLLGISGNKICDILDFKYLTSDDHYILEVRKKDGTSEEIEIFNDYYENLGVEFENPLIDKPMICKNHCIFCFMDQLPPNVRKTMLFKDDDIRLSFLQGNYATLTNLSESDIERLCKLKVSPINVSVHVTDKETRIKMLRNPNAANVLSIMKRFAQSGIVMNTQIVLCRGVNDGELLRKTLYDLAELYPAVRSISIVPVGLSKFRKSLAELNGFDALSSAEVINLVTPIQREFKQKYGSSLVYLADEFYIQGKMQIPPYEHYEEFPQIENGVGLVASMRDEIDTELSYIDEYDISSPCKKIIATSHIAYDFICECVDKIKKKAPNIDVETVKITNDFFGEKITVTGLLCGSDIINQLKGRKLPKYLMLSESMFKENTTLFLDDTTIEDVEDALGINVIVTPDSGSGFLKAVLM